MNINNQNIESDLIKQIREQIRDVVLFVNGLNKTANDINFFNFIKKTRFIDVLKELNSNAMLNDGELKKLYEKEKISINFLMGHCLNKGDYEFFCNVFNVEPIKNNCSQKNIVGMKYFMKLQSNQEFVDYISKVDSLTIKNISDRLKKLILLKNINDEELMLFHDLILAEISSVHANNLEVDNYKPETQFKNVLLKAFDMMNGRIPPESLKGFVNKYTDYCNSLQSLIVAKYDITSDETSDILLVMGKIHQWSGKLGASVNLECFSFLKEISQNSRKYDTENNLNLIVKHKEKLNQLMCFVKDENVYDAFINLTCLPKLDKSHLKYSEQDYVTFNKFLDSTTLLNFNEKDKLKNDILIIGRMDIPLGERAVFLGLYIENNKKLLQTESSVEIIKKSQNVLKKINLSYDECATLDKYLNTSLLKTVINYEGKEIPKNVICLNAVKVIDGKQVPMVLMNTSNLIQDKKIIESKISQITDLNDSLECFAGIDPTDNNLVMLPLKFERIPLVNFTNNNQEFKNQTGFCDIDILNDVFSKNMLMKKDFLTMPDLIKVNEHLLYLKNISIVNHQVEIEGIQLDFDNVRFNPKESFKIVKLMLSAKEYNDIKPATEMENLIFSQNMCFAKNNMNNPKMNNIKIKTMKP